MVGKPLPQPTLPSLNLEDDEEFNGSKARSTPAPSIYTADYFNANDYPPPMPQYNPYSNCGAEFNPSQTTLYDHGVAYDHDNESQAHLTTTAAPIAQQPGYRMTSRSQDVYAFQTQRHSPVPPGMGHDGYGSSQVSGGYSREHYPEGYWLSIVLFYLSVSVSVDAIPFLRLVVLDVLMAVYVCPTLHPIICHSICRGPFYRPVYGAL